MFAPCKIIFSAKTGLLALLLVIFSSLSLSAAPFLPALETPVPDEAHDFLAQHQNAENPQMLLVQNGLARVHPLPDTEKIAKKLLPHEAKARAAKTGLWADPRYQPHQADDAGKLIGQFGLVEGTIRKSAKAAGKIFLNFGNDYRSDFTLVLSPRLAKQLAKKGFDWEQAAGRLVRARGWVEPRGGPQITITTLSQLEIL